MAEFSGWTAGLAAAATVILTSGFAMAEPGLVGPVRDTVVESAFRTCFDRRDEPQNKDVPVATMAQYCVCYADQVADQIANDDVQALDDLAKKDPAALAVKMDPLMKAAVATCAARFRGQ